MTLRRNGVRNIAFAGVVLAVVILIGPFLSWRGMSDPIIAIEPAPPAIVCAALTTKGSVERWDDAYGNVSCEQTIEIEPEGGLPARQITLAVSSIAAQMAEAALTDIPPDLRVALSPCLGGDVSPTTRSLDIDYIMENCRFFVDYGVGVSFAGLGRTFLVTAVFTEDRAVTRGQLNRLETLFTGAVSSMIDTLHKNVEYRSSPYSSPVTWSAQVVLAALVAWLGWRGVRDLRRWHRSGANTDEPFRTALSVAGWPAAFVAIAVTLGATGIVSPYRTDNAVYSPATSKIDESNIEIRPDAADDPVFARPAPAIDDVTAICDAIHAAVAENHPDVRPLVTDDIQCSVRLDDDGGPRLTFSWMDIEPSHIPADPANRTHCTEPGVNVRVVNDVDVCVSFDDSWGITMSATFYTRAMYFGVDFMTPSTASAEDLYEIVVPVIVTAIEEAP